ncbi:MAG: hypothetical protein L3K16_05170 [Thermoplasmata archaeon]|nr:hypothetical protein [Thermoplasmata archaeon]
MTSRMSSDGSGRIAVSLGPAPIPLAGPLRVRRAATIAGALRSGLRILDLTDTPGPATAWEFARDAAAELWTDLTVVVAEAPTGEPGSPAPARVAVVRPNAPAPGTGAARNPESGVRFSELGAAEAGIAAAASAGARWVAVPGSLLAAPRLISLAPLARRAGAELLLTNPHADGRLDGLWLNDGLGIDSRRTHPVDFREIERAYAPVLALRFLTESRRRTLPQAAVAFAWAIGAIPSVRFRDLAQVAAFGRPLEIAPLADAELERLSTGDLPRRAD